MRIWITVLVLILAAGASRGASPPKAIYLAPATGGLSAEDLKAHPEIVVAKKFEELRDQAGKKVALWIDKDAIRQVYPAWLHWDPQRLYPLAVVGYCDSLYAFREKLGGFWIFGPPVDWSKRTVEPGFSVWMITKADPKAPSGWTEAVCKGYPGKPTVQAILKITDRLLEGKLPD